MNLASIVNYDFVQSVLNVYITGYREDSYQINKNRYFVMSHLHWEDLNHPHQNIATEEMHEMHENWIELMLMHNIIHKVSMKRTSLNVLIVQLAWCS